MSNQRPSSQGQPAAGLYPPARRIWSPGNLASRSSPPPQRATQYSGSARPNAQVLRCPRKVQSPGVAGVPPGSLGGIGSP